MAFMPKVILEASLDMARPLRIPCPEPVVYPSEGGLNVIKVTIGPPGQNDQDCQLLQQEVLPLNHCLMIDQLLSEGIAQGADGKQVVWKKLLMLSFGYFGYYPEEKIIELLSRDVEYNGSRYCFLGFSESDLKIKTCFLIAENDMQIRERRAKCSNFSKNVSFAERVAKVQDLFQPYEFSVELAQSEFSFETEDGLPEGSGFMAPKLARKINQRAALNLPSGPSVVEVICPGFAGKLLLSDEILERTTGEEHSHPRLKALFKTSATTKDHGNALTLCIVDYSKPFEVGYLDIFTVMLLHYHGVKSQYLLDLQKEHHNLLQMLETDLTSAKYFLRLNGRKELLVEMDNIVTPEARKKISKIKEVEFRKMHECRNGPEEFRILVSESRQVLGVVDPDDQLQSNECFFAPNLDGMLPYEKDRFKSAKQVLVIPQPCYSPSDIQKFELSRQIEAYEKFKDCIILPSQVGKRFVSRKYCVCWDTCLVLQFNPSAWNFPTIPRQVSEFVLGIFQYINVKFFLWSSSPEDVEDASFQKELKKHFAKFKSSDDLIFRAKSLFIKFALLEGSAACSVCKSLGTYLSPSFDWNAKRDEIARHFEDLDKRYELLRSKVKQDGKSQDLRELYTALNKNLNDFIVDSTRRQGFPQTYLTGRRGPFQT